MLYFFLRKRNRNRKNKAKAEQSGMNGAVEESNLPPLSIQVSTFCFINFINY